ncbi:MAG: asparagine synthase C-terminal domain-containing protein, partial [Alphaproteobacteria bacterium]|nr:asparagine synthase C-terminal domain-containing protein [Alphaproteobacteria bacterium]
VYHREGRVQRHRWHQWPDPTERTQAPSPDLAALIVEATRLRLRADAPTRLLLSGGLDSAIVAASAAEVLGDQRQHFRGALVYGYGPDHLADESAGATAVAERYRLDLARLTVTPVPDRADLDGVMDAQEEPFTTPSLVGLYRIARALADEGVKVALTGEGSDELFAGYTRRYAPLTALAALGRGNVRTPWALLRGKHTSPKNLAAALAWRLGPRVAGQVLRRSHPSAACIARDVWHRHQDRLEDYCRDRSQDLGARLSTDVIRTGLPAILRYGDRSGMAFGVEVRSPFLDYRVVEAALRLDPAHLLDARGGKVPLRMAFADRLPMDRIGWQKRAGLGQAEQFTIGALAIQDLLDDPPAGAADWLDLSRLRRQLAAMPSNPVLWLPIALLLWLRAQERW